MDPFAPQDAVDENGIPLDPAALDEGEPADLPALPAPIPIGVVPPRWYKKPPKPKLDDVLADAERERAVHQKRIDQTAFAIRRYNLKEKGLFERDEDDALSGESEEPLVTALRNETDALCNALARMDWHVQAPVRADFLKDEAQAKENAVQFLFDCARRQHARAGGGDLARDMAWILVHYGLLVSYDGIDPDDDECGLRFRIEDPATCFPVWEAERGLAALYRIYTREASYVMGAFGGYSQGAARKIRDTAKGADGRYDPTYEAEVVEYWDRNWLLVAYEGRQLLLVEHGYSRVPFTVTPLSVTQPGVISAPDYLGFNQMFGTSRTLSNREDDLARICQPFFAAQAEANDLEEAVQRRLLTALRRNQNPPVVVTQSTTSSVQGDIEIDPSEGGQTRLREGDTIAPYPNMPAPEVLSPLMAMLQQNRQTGMAPGVLMGNAPAQTSGSAADSLAESGFEKWTPVSDALQRHLTERAMWWLTLLKGFWPVLDCELTDGSILDRGALDRGGTRVSVELRKFSKTTMNAIGNALLQINSLGVIDKRSMIDLLGFTNDPEGVLARVKREALDQVPEVLDADTIAELIKEIQAAAAKGDADAVEILTARAQFITTQMAQRRQQQAQMQLAMGMQGPQPIQQKNQPAPNPSLGQSLPMLGVGVGQQGGRPPGSGGMMGM